MTTGRARLPSRLRRLDGALADLPLDAPMLLSELDGFLTGVIVSPHAIAPTEWMQSVWGLDADGIAPFEDPLDVAWFRDAVLAHRDTIRRALDRGKMQPIFDIDDRNGDRLWEPWLDGFAEAVALRPDGWPRDDERGAEAMACLDTLMAAADDDGTLDSMQIEALHEGAPAAIVDAVRRLYALGSNPVAAAAASVAVAAKVGRNAPCPCGSGVKAKRCCA